MPTPFHLVCVCMCVYTVSTTANVIYRFSCRKKVCNRLSRASGTREKKVHKNSVVNGIGKEEEEILLRSFIYFYIYTLNNKGFGLCVLDCKKKSTTALCVNKKSAAAQILETDDDDNYATTITKGKKPAAEEE